jgi:uncharacterized membrane protein (UPF0182 family)
MPETINWPMHSRPSQSHRRTLVLLLVIVAVILFSSRTAVSYWVDLLWFQSLGYGEVFWKTRGLEWSVFAGFTIVTFLILFGSFLALRRAHADDLPSTHTIIFAGQTFDLPVATALRVVAIIIAALISLVTGGAIAAQWPALALYWYAPASPASTLDPIFGFLSVHLAGVAALFRMAAHDGSHLHRRGCAVCAIHGRRPRYERTA